MLAFATFTCLACALSSDYYILQENHICTSKTKHELQHQELRFTTTNPFLRDNSQITPFGTSGINLPDFSISIAVVFLLASC